MTELRFIKKNVFGLERIYPAQDDLHAQIFATIARRKTLERHELELITKLGYQIRIEGDESEVLQAQQGGLASCA